MKRSMYIMVIWLAMIIIVPDLCMAFQHHRNHMRDGSVVNQFCFSSYESKRIRDEFGYNWVVADRIVKTLFREANIPSTFTAKVGEAGALFVAISSTAYVVWDQARRHGDNTSWCLRYHTHPYQMKLIDDTLGKIGDKIMPFGQGANIIIGVINDILNTITITR